MAEQQWPEEAVEDAALQIHWKRHGHDDPNSLQPCAGPTDTDRAWARAVLAALAPHVVPRQAVLDIADEWKSPARDEYPPGHFTATSRAAQLRALVDHAPTAPSRAPGGPA